MEKSKWEKILKDSGAAEVKHMAVDRNWFNPELRSYCTEDSCRRYGTSYGCPPAAGQAEELIEEACSYRQIMVYSIVSEMENGCTPEAMQELTLNLHGIGESLIRAGIRSESEVLLLGAGGCYHCEECSLLHGEECPTPEWKQASMSAYCIKVQQMAQDAGIAYDQGQGTLTMFGAVFYND